MPDLPPIRTQGSLTHYGALHAGYPTQPHLSRDWRFEADWVMTGVEFIPELRCIAPAGNCTPLAQAISEWTLGGNERWREADMPGQHECLWLEYYDSTVYAAGTSAETFAGGIESSATYQPNIALHISRTLPPSGQGVPSQTSLTMYCQMWDGAAWQDGKATLMLPLENPRVTRPFLHTITPRPSGSYDVFNSGSIVSWAPDAATQAQDTQRLTWTVEYIPHPESTGGWILLRNSVGLRWLYHNTALRLVAGPLIVTCSGCRQSVNVTPVVYATDDNLSLQAFPQYVCPLPTSSGNTWPSTAAWNGCASAATGWITQVSQMPGDVYRPLVQFLRGGSVNTHLRPIAWYCHETHAAAITSGGGTASSTQGLHILNALSLSQNSKWRGASGTGEFVAAETAQLTTWKEGGAVVINLGWQTGSGALAAENLLTAFIKPGGIKRETNEDFGAKLTVEFEDFGAKLTRTKLVDVRQGGGLYAGDYFRLVADSLGVPAAAVDVAAACETMVIPYRDLPSDPAFAPRDGVDPITFLDEVFTKAMGLRWGTCKDSTHLMFLDEGAPTYAAGTSSISLHVTRAAVDETFLRHAAHSRNTIGFTNGIKLIVGKGSTAQVSYWVQPQTEREAGIGGINWRAVRVDAAADAAAAIASLRLENYDALSDVIEFSTILRPDLKPDAFVMLDDDLQIGIPAGSVYQITESRPKAEGGPKQDHDFAAKLVALGVS